MSRARRSLRDRDEFAIAHTEDDTAEAPATPVVPPAPAEDTEPVRSASKARLDAFAEERSRSRTATPPASTPARPSQARGASTQRIGMYFRSAEAFAAAKSAYIADFQHVPDSPDTFAGWIAAAIEAHAARTPEQRAEITTTHGTDQKGITRSFSVPDAAVNAMTAAIGADYRAFPGGVAGRYPSKFKFCGEAIAAAVDAARERAGGHLDPPPDRLPNRLVR